MRMWTKDGIFCSIVNFLLKFFFIIEHSLDGLIQDLKKRKPDHPFDILRQSQITKTNGVFDEEKFEVLKNGKSRLPYEKLTFQYLFHTTNVPSKADYYSDLTNSNIDDETYEDIQKFWWFQLDLNMAKKSKLMIEIFFSRSVFKCKNLAEYSAIYVNLDAIILAEIFQEFRSSILSWSGLDPDFYLGKVTS